MQCKVCTTAQCSDSNGDCYQCVHSGTIDKQCPPSMVYETGVSNVYTAMPPKGGVQLYECKRGADYFESTSKSCEGVFSCTSRCAHIPTSKLTHETHANGYTNQHET